MSLEQLRENYYRLEADYTKRNEEIDKLQGEVKRLEDKLLILRNSIINAPIVLNFSGMIHRWSDDLVESIDQKGG